MKLKNVLIVPHIKKNLIYVGQLTGDNFCCKTFSVNDFVVENEQRNIIPRGQKKGGLYALEDIKQEALTAINRASQNVWHQRMGHPHSKFLKSLQSKKLIDISSWDKTKNICASCQMGKSRKLPFSSSNHFSKFPFEKLHCDLWGPAPISSCQGFKYYAIIIDDFTRYS